MVARKIMINCPTESLCPVCLARIPAHRVACGDDSFLQKCCPVHGSFQTLIWKGTPSMAGWHRPKIPTQPLALGHAVDKGCPFDCGLCAAHQQRSCTVIFEVTTQCNLGCRYCFADAGRPSTDPSPATVADWLDRLSHSGTTCNIQFSGGEPTLRDDLPELITMGRTRGFDFIQINTNGLRLAQEPSYAKSLKAAGAASIFLQFDGVADAVYEQLRGRALWEVKQAVVQACAEAGLGVVLVPTVVPGCNLEAVGKILEVALSWHPTVRGVHFQPVSYFGRHPGPPADKDRITLPELMQAIEDQTRGVFKAAHFRPPGCEHSLCSFHAQYLISAQGAPHPLHPIAPQWPTQSPIRAEEGAARAIGAVARQWAGAPAAKPVLFPALCAKTCSCSGSVFPPDTMPNATSNVTSNVALNVTSNATPNVTAKAAITPSKGPPIGQQPVSLDDFLTMARTGTFSVSAMAFQDVWNLDLERVRQCCIHVMAPDGRLVPFCLYNLTAADGRPLYRS